MDDFGVTYNNNNNNLLLKNGVYPSTVVGCMLGYLYNKSTEAVLEAQGVFFEFEDNHNTLDNFCTHDAFKDIFNAVRLTLSSFLPATKHFIFFHFNFCLVMLNTLV